MLFLLVLVLAAHWGGLSWLSQQTRYGQPLVLMPEPLFTRMIIPAPAPVPAPPRRREASVRAPETVAVATEEMAAIDTASSEPSEPSVTPVSQDGATPAGPEPQAPVVASPTPTEPSAPPADWPPDTRVTYQLKGYYRGDISGSARVLWQRELERYQARLDVSLGLVLRVSMISQGVTTPTGLVPQAYEERFLWDVRRMTFADGFARLPDGTRLAQAQPQALQDTVSQFIELSQRFSSGREALSVGSPVRIWLARPQGTPLWTYDVVAEETLQLPELGPVPALHLRPRPIENPAGVITAELWFAPGLQYLPVQVRIALGEGNHVELLAERIEQGAAPADAVPEPRKP